MFTIPAARKLISFTTLAFVCCPPALSQQARKQSAFCSECEVMHPIETPKNVWDLLRKDQLVIDTLKEENLSLEQLPNSWFCTTEIALGMADEADYLVQAQSYLAGAHATHFWIFRQTHSGTELVLQSFANGLDILRRRSNNLQEIETENITAVSFVKTYYHFVGNHYVQFKQQRGNL